MRLIEHSVDYLGIRLIDRKAPEGTVTLLDERVQDAYTRLASLFVAALPVSVSYPKTDPETGLPGGPLQVKRITDTDLGRRGLRSVLTVSEYFPPTLSMGMADPEAVNDVLAKVDLAIDGIVPPLGLRGVLLRTVTDEGDMVFQEDSLAYDDGGFRRAGLPWGTHPSINAVPGVPPAPGSA